MNLIRRTTILLIAAALATLASPAVGQPERGIQLGQKIVPRQVKVLEGQDITLPAEEGMTVLLFWSTWSPRSSSAIEIWQRYAQRYQDYGVTVMSVNADNQHMDEADIRRIRDYIAEYKVTLPVILDSGLEMFNEIGVIVLPTTLFFTPDGTLDYKYPGLPSSAELDIKKDLEARLGIAPEPETGKEAPGGELAYQPKNNALLFYNMGKMYQEKGSPEKAKAKHIESLQRDREYRDPLRALEGIFFADGKTPETVERLKTLLTASGLEEVITEISEGEDAPGQEGKTTEPVTMPTDAARTGQDNSPAATPDDENLSPMERMRLLMEGSK